MRLAAIRLGDRDNPLHLLGDEICKGSASQHIKHTHCNPIQNKSMLPDGCQDVFSASHAQWKLLSKQARIYLDTDLWTVQC